MPKFKVVVEIESPDIMMAELAAQGIQNVINELGEHQNYLIELADASLARSYKTKILNLINSKIFKSFAGKLGV